MEATTSISSGNIKVLTFSLPTILASQSSVDTILSLGDYSKTVGRIYGVYVVCASTDYTVSLRTSTGVVVPHIDEKYRIENVDKYDFRVDLGVLFNNTGNLYCTITNTDSVNATGTITLQIILE